MYRNATHRWDVETLIVREWHSATLVTWYKMKIIYMLFIISQWENIIVVLDYFIETWTLYKRALI